MRKQIKAAFSGSVFGLVALCSGPSTAIACDSAYTGYSCDNGGSNICTMIGTDWVCDLARNGATSGGELRMVFSDSLCQGDNDYCAWGTDASGSPFCCSIEGEAATPTKAVIIGSDNNDSIYLTYSTYNLDNYDTSGQFDGVVLAGEGDDTIEGSSSASAYYEDRLSGGPGVDSIEGHAGADFLEGEGMGDGLFGGAGDDYISGGDGEDQIGGGPDNDQILGGPDDDIVDGGSGQDAIYGGTGDDWMLGGSGNDSMYGEAGSDVLCGETDSSGDTLMGGSGDDYLWGANSTDTKDGGLHTTTDYCDVQGSNTGCETPLTSAPTECPSSP